MYSCHTNSSHAVTVTVVYLTRATMCSFTATRRHNERFVHISFIMCKRNLTQTTQLNDCDLEHKCYGCSLYMFIKILYSSLQPLLLTGHHGDISAMTFGKRSSPVTLCSASSEYIIIWDIQACQKRQEEGKSSSVYINVCSAVLSYFLAAFVMLAYQLFNKNILFFHKSV